MLNWINKKRNKKGFTLVELVVVIAILGILAGIAVPKFSESRKNAAIAAHNANVRTLESAATLAVSEGIDFETVGEGNEKDKVTWNGQDYSNSIPKHGWQNYLQSWPEVPTGVKGQKFTVEGVENTDIAVKYSVEIRKDGTIKVVSGKIDQ